MSAVITDFDGTLCSSEEVWLAILQDRYRAVGVTFPREEYLASVGGPSTSFDPFTTLSQASRVSAGDIERELEHLVERELIHTGPVPDTRELLAYARSMGLALAIASNGRPASIERILIGWGMREWFVEVNGRTDDQPQKPHPFVYVKTLRRLGLPPARAMALEDSAAGEVAASGAGLPCFSLAGGTSAGRGVTRVSSFADARVMSHVRRLAAMT